MSELEHRYLDVNGIRMHVAEQGKGPLVLLCHGWPELWYSYRHQLPALAAAGFRAVAPDMRGYGETSAPEQVSAYSLLHLVGDMVALVTALCESSAVVVGHDWGAPVAWACAQMRPDVFRAVSAMSVPYRGRGPAEPLEMLRKSGWGDYYFLYFQEPGVAEAELERDVRTSVRTILFGLSGDAPPGSEALGRVPAGSGFLDGCANPEQLPPWLTEQDVDTFVAAYARTGFRGGLNWYRNLSRNWALSSPWQGAKITQPALFIAGTRDPVNFGRRGVQALANMEVAVPNLRKLILEGAGHWIQQERPREVNQALISFLQSLG
jgi:pimeloyl-ACP methyl ester carboxylesterase